MNDLLNQGQMLSSEVTARQDAVMAEELGLLIDGATNYAIYMLDPQGLVTIWNRDAERIHGWTESEVIGCHFKIFYPPDDTAAGKPQANLDVANELGRLKGQRWQLRKDGSEFLASVTITALRDGDGALRGFGKVVCDTTDQVAADRVVKRRERHLRSILASVPDAILFSPRAAPSHLSVRLLKRFSDMPRKM